MQPTHFRGMDADVYRSSVGLLTLDPLDVHNELLAVHLHDLANLLTLVVTAHNLFNTMRGAYTRNRNTADAESASEGR